MSSTMIQNSNDVQFYNLCLVHIYSVVFKDFSLAAFQIAVYLYKCVFSLLSFSSDSDKFYSHLRISRSSYFIILFIYLKEEDILMSFSNLMCICVYIIYINTDT